LWDWGSHSGFPTCLVGALQFDQASSPALVILEVGVSGTICLGCPLTEILLISPSQVCRITRGSHCLPVYIFFFLQYWGLNPWPKWVLGKHSIFPAIPPVLYFH
jgi:hypothetical protein